MKGLEPSTFCMASQRKRSRPFAETANSQGILRIDRTRAHPNEERV